MTVAANRPDPNDSDPTSRQRFTFFITAIGVGIMGATAMTMWPSAGDAIELIASAVLAAIAMWWSRS